MALTEEDSPLPDVLAGNWSRETLTALAREMGVIRRTRKKEIWVLVWVLLLGMSSGSRRTLTGLMESYNQYAQQMVSSSTFQGWLSATLARMLKRMLLDAFQQTHTAWRIPEHLLDGFVELLAIDSTVLNLHRFLRKYYPSTQKTGAAAKLHVVINVLDASIRRLKLTGQRTNDNTPWRRLGGWVRGRLLLFDLGYYDFNLFSRIEDNGGFFVSRVKSNANPLIIENLRPCRGQRIAVVGQRLQDLLPRLQRDVLDVIVEVQVKKRKYNGKQRTVTRRFRLVGLRRLYRAMPRGAGRRSENIGGLRTVNTTSSTSPSAKMTVASAKGTLPRISPPSVALPSTSSTRRSPPRAASNTADSSPPSIRHQDT